MSTVNVTNISVLNNPAKFSSPFQFEITFTCEQDLPDDLEWTLTYVGSSESKKHDQQLDSVAVGPVCRGTHKFVLETPAPNPELIPPGDIVGVTVCIITCSYREKEFIRIGYYVNNELANSDGAVKTVDVDDAMDIMESEGEEDEDEDDDVDEFYNENSNSGNAAGTISSSAAAKTATGAAVPERIDPEMVMRSILANEPRVTRFVIPWE